MIRSLAFVPIAMAALAAAKTAPAGGGGAMDWLEGAVVFILVLGVLVFVHELGHFAVAKLAGMRVDEFAFGFGPKLVTLFKKGGTDYTIHPFPMGGFVRIAGMEPGEDQTVPGGYNTKPLLSRMAVILAGPAMNMVLALVVFIAMGSTVGSPVRGVVVDEVKPNTEAARVGLHKGDSIVSIDGEPMLFAPQAVDLIHRSVNKPITITVLRDGKQRDYRVTPQPATPERLGEKPTPELLKYLRERPYGVIGFQAGQDPLFRKTPIGESIANGFIYTYGTTKMMLVTIFGRIGGAAVGAVPVSEVKREVGGPIAIFFVVKGSVEKGLAMVVLLVALLSVNLGVVNLLPIPVLDGGHLVLLAIEGIRRKRLSPEKQAIVQWVGLSIILLLMVLIFYNDISRIGDYVGK